MVRFNYLTCFVKYSKLKLFSINIFISLENQSKNLHNPRQNATVVAFYYHHELFLTNLATIKTCRSSQNLSKDHAKHCKSFSVSELQLSSITFWYRSWSETCNFFLKTSYVSIWYCVESQKVNYLTLVMVGSVALPSQLPTNIWCVQ